MTKKTNSTILVLLIFLCGCQTYPVRIDEKGSTLATASSVRFDDLPIPENFYYLPDKSFIFEYSDSRVGILKYGGKATPHAIINFFKETMPQAGWKQISIIEGGSSVMYYSTEAETCMISIEYAPKEVFVTFTVSPNDQSP